MHTRKLRPLAEPEFGLVHLKADDSVKWSNSLIAKGLNNASLSSTKSVIEIRETNASPELCKFDESPTNVLHYQKRKFKPYFNLQNYLGQTDYEIEEYKS